MIRYLLAPFRRLQGNGASAAGTETYLVELGLRPRSRSGFFMGTVSFDDACRILERFRATRARVRVSGMGFGWSLGFAGYVAAIDRGALRFMLPNGDEALALRLDMDDTTFWSGDVGEVPIELRRGIALLNEAVSFVGVTLPYRVAPEALSGPVCAEELRPRERIFFCELPPAHGTG